MQINITIDEAELRKLIEEKLRDVLGNVVLDPKKIEIQTKSKQNYRSEWESAAFRATYIAL